MPHEIADPLQVDLILNESLSAFEAALDPITAFAHVFSDVQLQGTDKIQVPYVPIQDATVRDFNQTNGYQIDRDSKLESREVTVNRRKYVSLGFTSEELARQPQLAARRAEIFRQKARVLAGYVIQDVLSLVTPENFGLILSEVSSETWDRDDILAIKRILDKEDPDPDTGGNRWPADGRSLIFSSDYENNLLTDDILVKVNERGDDQGLRRGRVGGNLFDFDLKTTNNIPALDQEAGQKLAAMAVHESAILFATAPIEPAMKEVAHTYASVPETGLSLQLREWGDPDKDIVKMVLECNYGFAFGEKHALKRITEAA